MNPLLYYMFCLTNSSSLYIPFNFQSSHSLLRAVLHTVTHSSLVYHLAVPTLQSLCFTCSKLLTNATVKLLYQNLLSIKLSPPSVWD